MGLYLLAIYIRRLSQVAALLGFLVGLAVVCFVAFGTNTSWPWYTAVGTLTVFVSGAIANLFFPRQVNNG